VIIISDAGFHNAWFRLVKSLRKDFITRVRGNSQLRLYNKGNAGSDLMPFWPVAGLYIWLPEGSAGLDMPAATITFIIIKENQKTEKLNEGAHASGLNAEYSALEASSEEYRCDNLTALSVSGA